VFRSRNEGFAKLGRDSTKYVVLVLRTECFEASCVEPMFRVPSTPHDTPGERTQFACRRVDKLTSANDRKRPPLRTAGFAESRHPQARAGAHGSPRNWQN